MPIAQDLNALYAGADTGAITSIIAKLAVEKSLHGKLEVPPPHMFMNSYVLVSQSQAHSRCKKSHLQQVGLAWFVNLYRVVQNCAEWHGLLPSGVAGRRGRVNEADAVKPIAG